MNKTIAVVLFLLLLGAAAWWILKDRPKAESPYADTLLRSLDRAKSEQVRGDFRTVHQALTSYMSSAGEYPATSDAAELGRLLGPYIVRYDPTDPWGTAYRYEGSGGSYTFTSAGADRRFGTPDDAAMRDGSMSGLPEGGLGRF